MKMRSLKFVSVVSVGTLLASCADNSENQYWEGNESTVVVTRVAGFDFLPFGGYKDPGEFFEITK